MIYTDGSADNNKNLRLDVKTSAFGACVIDDAQMIIRCYYSKSESNGSQTNNVAELQALTLGVMLALKFSEDSPIFSDSEYAIGCFENANNSVFNDTIPRKHRIPNFDLIKKLQSVKQLIPNANINWVKGHSGECLGNEIADYLAGAIRISTESELDLELMVQKFNRKRKNPKIFKAINDYTLVNHPLPLNYLN